MDYNESLILISKISFFQMLQAARLSGRKPIPGIRYKKQAWTLSSPRLRWIAEMEAVETCAELAMAVRKLDAVLNWESVVKPRGLASDAPFANATVQGKRPAADGSGYEYLIEIKPSPAMEAAAAQQQQLQAAFQQRIAMSHAMYLQAQQAQMQANLGQQGSSGVPPGSGMLPGQSAQALPNRPQQQHPGRLGTLGQWPTPNLGMGGPGIVGMGAPVLQAIQQPQAAGAPPAVPLASELTAVQPGLVQPGAVTITTGSEEVPLVKPEENGLQGVSMMPFEGLLAGQAAAEIPPATAPSAAAAPAPLPPPSSAFQNAVPSMLPPFGFLQGGLPGMVPPAVVLPPMSAPAAALPAAAVSPTEQQKKNSVEAPKKGSSPKEEKAEEEEENIGREIVQTAIKKALEKEEEERLLNMPAAMAAKMRSRQLAGAGNTSTGDLKKAGGSNANEAVAGKEISPGAGASQPTAAQPPQHPGLPAALQGVPPALMPFMGYMQARPQLQGPPPPSWVHEKDIPLWFIRSYEELVSFIVYSIVKLSSRVIQSYIILLGTVIMRYLFQLL